MLDYQYKLGVLHAFVISKLNELNKRIKSECKTKVEESKSKSKSPAILKRQTKSLKKSEANRKALLEKAEQMRKLQAEKSSSWSNSNS